MTERPDAILPEQLLKTLFQIAVASAQPAKALDDLKIKPNQGRTVVLSAGKASVAMARALESSGIAIDTGLILCPTGMAEAVEPFEVMEANHPIPSDEGVAASSKILKVAQALKSPDRLIVLLSGGASALLCLPASSLTLTEKKDLTDQLLASGATIKEINCLRKHLSDIKGGRLAAAAYPAECMTFAISDVVGDSPAVIASGPTVGDPTTQQDALDIVSRLQLSLTDAQQRHLRDPSNETPKPGDPKLSNSHFHILASSQTALAAAEHHAKSLGVHVLNLGQGVEGEARQVAKNHAEIARQHAQKGETVAILSGGELTVTKPRGDQAGGPNHEYALALAIELDGAPDIFAIACDTDGIDGRTDAAGALIGPDTIQRARALGQDPVQALTTHNSGDFFAALKANVVTGPTNTNVNDFRCLLLNPKALNRK